MLDPTELAAVQRTLPLFKQYRTQVAVQLYRHVFSQDMTLRDLFSLEFLWPRGRPVNAEPGHDTLQPPVSTQAAILADSIVDFCAHVTDLRGFAPTLERICAKHVSRFVQPNHYTVVANAFVSAMRDVFGNALSEQDMAAWTSAVNELAKILISRETELYNERSSAIGGWQGFRQFLVASREEHSAGAILTLSPVDGERIPRPEPGQYVCLRASTPHGPVHRSATLGRDAEPGTYVIDLSVPRNPIPHAGCPVQGMTATNQVLWDLLITGAAVQLSVPVGGYSINKRETKANPLLAGGLRARVEERLRVAEEIGGPPQMACPHPRASAIQTRVPAIQPVPSPFQRMLPQRQMRPLPYHNQATFPARPSILQSRPSTIPAQSLSLPIRTTAPSVEPLEPCNEATEANGTFFTEEVRAEIPTMQHESVGLELGSPSAQTRPSVALPLQPGEKEPQEIQHLGLGKAAAEPSTKVVPASLARLRKEL